MKKILGYILALAGVASFTLTAKPIRDFIGIPIPEVITNTYLISIGLALVILGIFIIKPSREKAPQEVPIYKGKKIVGYRRQ